ncbi:hypothetical protein D9M69_603910 [compost metagenome]
MVMPSWPARGCSRYVPKRRSHQVRLKPKLELLSSSSTEWCTRCMSGVTRNQRSARSTPAGRRMLPWLKVAQALSTISNTTTASTGAPSSVMVANLMPMESTISSGWNRVPVVRS